MTPSAAPGILAVEGVVALVLAFAMLFRYANLRKQNPLVTGTTLLIWFLSFFIVFLLPIDVTSVSSCLFIILIMHYILNNSLFITTAWRTCGVMILTRHTAVRIMGVQKQYSMMSAVTSVTSLCHLSVNHL